MRKNLNKPLINVTKVTSNEEKLRRKFQVFLTINSKAESLPVSRTN